MFLEAEAPRNGFLISYLSTRTNAFVLPLIFLINCHDTYVMISKMLHINLKEFRSATQYV